MKSRAGKLLVLAVLLAVKNAVAAPPTVFCSLRQVIQCTSSNGELAVVRASVRDADGDALLVTWQINQGAPVTNALPAGNTTNAATLSFTNTFPLGTNVVLVSASDDGVTFVTCDSLVVVRDHRAPVIQSITATPSTLWPPNHRMVPVHLNVQATDDCGPVQWRIAAIRSSEAVNAPGSGHTAPDWLIAGPHLALLRAERSGRGPGRTYSIILEVSDLSGNTVALLGAEVIVPHSLERGNAKGRDPQ